MNKHYTAALDIGSSKIVMALAISDTNHNYEIIAISEQSHNAMKRGLVMNIDKTVKAIKACVNDIFKQTGIQIKTVNVNCNGQHIKMTKKRLSFDLEPKEFESDLFDYISLIKRTYPTLFENNVEIIQVTPISEPLSVESQTTIDFSLITGYRAAIENLKNAIELSGLEINQLVPDPLSASHSVLSAKEKEEGVVLVDIGRDTSSVVIYHKNTIYKLFTFPAGGNDINRALIACYHISNQQAETIKLQYGIVKKEHISEQDKIFIQEFNNSNHNSHYLIDLQIITQTITKEIVNAIMSNCKDISSSYSPQHGIVITGGAARLKHLDITITEMTGLEVRLGLPCWNDKTKAFTKLNHPSYATVLGSISAHYKQ